VATINWERWARCAGVGFVVLTVAAFIVGGESPMVSDSAEEVVSYYDSERGQVLVACFLFGVALGFWVWFAGAVASNLRERGQGRVAATIIGAVATFAAVQLVGTGINAVLAYSIAEGGEAGIAKALFDLTWASDVLAAVPSAVFFAAAAMGLSRTGMIPRWLSWAGLGVAALFALRTTNWASDGFWSPTGGFLFVLIPLALLWILMTSVVLMRRSNESVAGSEQVPASTI
jgi:hypothetical protein